MTQRRPSILVERLGRANAERLVAEFGGTRLAVPMRTDAATSIALRLGDHLATLLVLHFGDSRLSVPLSLDGQKPRATVDEKRVARLLGKGWSNARIARSLGCHVRTVELKRAAIRNRSTAKEAR